METKLSNFLSDGLFKKIGREDKGNWRRIRAVFPDLGSRE